MSKKNSSVNAEVLSSYLKDIVSKIQTEEDPLVLNEYRAIFKKNVPLHLRSYVAGYIANAITSKGGYKQNRNRNYHEKYENSRNYSQESFSREKNAEPKETEARPKTPRVEIPEDEAATIYIGIGRSRNVFPRDFVGLISQVCGVDRDRIGAIKVLEKYSFVTLYKTDADNVIAKLNNYSYRGRTLNVSYSNSKKRDEEGASEETEETSNENHEALV